MLPSFGPSPPSSRSPIMFCVNVDAVLVDAPDGDAWGVMALVRDMPYLTWQVVHYNYIPSGLLLLYFTTGSMVCRYNYLSNSSHN